MDFDKNKVRIKIAISKIKEENDMAIKNKRLEGVFKKVATVMVGIVFSTGVVLAGNKVYEAVWKTPEKIQLSYSDFEDNTKITEESKKENISEDDAKKIAIDKLKNVGLNYDIVGTNHYKEYDSNKIMYRFDTKDNYEISINGQNGELFDVWNNNKNAQDTSKYMTENQAKELANKYYNLFGYQDGEYEITKVKSVNNEGTGVGPGFRMTVIYNKKYDDVYNPYEYIVITLESKNMSLAMFRVENIPFDNNEVCISESDAIDIALKEDEKIDMPKVESTKVELMVVKMNADAYDRVNNKEKYYEAMQTPDYPAEERNFYKVDDKIRRAWVVVIKYENNFGEDIAKRYTEGSYSYFVDATTGEIIGGHVLDYIYSANL
mgnify:CR=1 FL=1